MKTSNKSKSKKKMSSQSGKKFKTEEDFFENILDININKPGSAYNFYIKDMMEKNKSKSVVETGKIHGPKWQKLSDKEKEKYEAKVTEEMERYNTHMGLVKKFLIDVDQLKEQVSPYMAFKRAYVDHAINVQQREPSEARRAAKDAWDDLSKEEAKAWEDEFEKNRDLQEELAKFKPGRVNAYSLYVRDRVANDGMNFKDAGAAWHNVSTKQKEKYEKYAEEENKEKRKLINLWEVMSGIKPKRPIGALTFFIRELSQKNELEGVKNIFSHASEKYKKLSDEEKDKFKKMAKQEKLEYSIKLAEHKKYLKSRFGRAPTAFNLYVQDKSNELQDEDLKAGELFHILNEKWKKEIESVKQKYIEKAEEEKKRYDQFKEEHLNLKAPSRPLNPYSIYIKEQYADVKAKNPKLISSEIFSIIAEKWNKLDDKDKKPYQNKSDLDKERYDREIEEFENEYGVRGRTRNTQRYYDDKRMTASKEKGYSKFKSQKAAISRSASRKRRSQSKSKSKSKTSVKSSQEVKGKSKKQGDKSKSRSNSKNKK